MGEGAMILLLTASAIYLSATQASIAGPTDTFRACLRQSVDKAGKDKVTGDAYEAYARNACSVEMTALKSAVVAFRMKNGMSKKAAGDDAEMTVDDYVATSVDKYQYLASENAKSGPPAAVAGAPPPVVKATPAAATQQPKP